MRCEVCGREIRGPPHRRIIEGARMTVCPQCARFGSGDWTPSRPKAPSRRQRPRSEVEAAERLELVEGYGEKIRKARERLRMTVEDLGRKINEKESVIKKLEREELTPDRRLVRKLKNALKIELLVVEEFPRAPTLPRPTRGRTLGDIIKMRQTPEESEDGEETKGE
ncbi:MAG: multiprotein bridging factor aMBF1 [Candidatus Bathyarchaeia archaeon]